MDSEILTIIKNHIKKNDFVDIETFLQLALYEKRAPLTLIPEPEKIDADGCQFNPPLVNVDISFGLPPK